MKNHATFYIESSKGLVTFDVKSREMLIIIQFEFIQEMEIIDLNGFEFIAGKRQISKIGWKIALAPFLNLIVIESQGSQVG